MDAEIDPEEVAALVAGGGVDGGVRIVDIRAPEAYAAGHVPGSENVPLAELPDRISELTGADRVITICPHGEASMQAARLISAFEGTDTARVESMAGGLEAYEGPLDSVSDPDRDTQTGNASDAPF